MASQCLIPPVSTTMDCSISLRMCGNDSGSKTNRMARSHRTGTWRQREETWTFVAKPPKVTSFLPAATSDDIISKQREEAVASCVSIIGVSISGADSEQLPAVVRVSPDNVRRAAAACRRLSARSLPINTDQYSYPLLQSKYQYRSILTSFTSVKALITPLKA